jgi:hypothetical protein
MSYIGNSLLCYGGNCCVWQWDILCWVLKLSAAWDKSEGLRYVRWEIFHSRWTEVLQLEWGLLQWTLYGRYFTGRGQWGWYSTFVMVSPYYVEIERAIKLLDTKLQNSHLIMAANKLKQIFNPDNHHNILHNRQLYITIKFNHKL